MSAPARPPYRVAIGGAVALALGLGVGRFAFAPLLPMMQADAGVTILGGSHLASANHVGYLIGALAGVRWRLDTPSTIGVALLAVALTTVAMGVTADDLAWLLLRGLAGGATACVLVATSAWTLARRAPSEHPRLTGLVFAGVGVGIVVAGALVLVAMAAGARSSEIWVTLGLVALAATAAAWVTLLREPESERDGARIGRPTVRRRLARSGIRDDGRILAPCYGVFGFAYIIPATFLPAAARNAVADPLLFGWAWPLFGFAAALSTLVAGRLSHRWSDRGIWVAGYVVMALGVALPALVAGVGPLFVASLAVGGTFLVITMVALREARSLAGDAAPEVIAAMTAAFAVGQILGPLAAGYLSELEGSFAPALLAAATLLLAAAAVLILDARRAQAIPAISERPRSP